MECCWPEGIEVKPDGAHDLSPHLFELEEVVENATVEILRCKICGKVSIGWTR